MKAGKSSVTKCHNVLLAISVMKFLRVDNNDWQYPGANCPTDVCINQGTSLSGCTLQISMRHNPLKGIWTLCENAAMVDEETNSQHLEKVVFYLPMSPIYKYVCAMYNVPLCNDDITLSALI